MSILRWTPQEQRELLRLWKEHGGDFTAIHKQMGTQRTPTALKAKFLSLTKPVILSLGTRLSSVEGGEALALEAAASPDTSKGLRVLAVEELLQGSPLDLEALLAPAPLSVDSFVVAGVLGRGGFGKVLRVLHTDTGDAFALKVQTKKDVKTRDDVRYLLTERRLQTSIQHPFVVSLQFAFQTDKEFFLGMEVCEGGSLHGLVRQRKRLPENLARLYAAEILLALEHLHGRRVIYRDLKPQNVLLDKTGHAKLTDFGLSKDKVGKKGAKSFCGTDPYLAPEIVEEQRYGAAVDLYALGVLIHEVLVGHRPFRAEGDALFEEIVNGDLRLPLWLSPEAADIIRRLLERRAERRLGSGGDFVSLKAHPFFRSIPFDKLAVRDFSFLSEGTVASLPVKAPRSSAPSSSSSSKSSSSSSHSNNQRQQHHPSLRSFLRTNTHDDDSEEEEEEGEEEDEEEMTEASRSGVSALASGICSADAAHGDSDRVQNVKQEEEKAKEGEAGAGTSTASQKEKEFQALLRKLPGWSLRLRAPGREPVPRPEQTSASALPPSAARQTNQQRQRAKVKTKNEKEEKAGGGHEKEKEKGTAVPNKAAGGGGRDKEGTDLPTQFLKGGARVIVHKREKKGGANEHSGTSPSPNGR